MSDEITESAGQTASVSGSEPSSRESTLVERVKALKEKESASQKGGGDENMKGEAGVDSEPPAKPKQKPKTPAKKGDGNDPPKATPEALEKAKRLGMPEELASSLGDKLESVLSHMEKQPKQAPAGEPKAEAAPQKPSAGPSGEQSLSDIVTGMKALLEKMTPDAGYAPEVTDLFGKMVAGLELTAKRDEQAREAQAKDADRRDAERKAEWIEMRIRNLDDRYHGLYGKGATAVDVRTGTNECNARVALYQRFQKNVARMAAAGEPENLDEAFDEALKVESYEHLKKLERAGLKKIAAERGGSFMEPPNRGGTSGARTPEEAERAGLAKVRGILQSVR